MAESDAALIRRVLDGDDQAATALYDRHVEFVYRTTRRYTADQGDAVEAAQDAFVHMFRRLATFRGRSGFRTWLFRIAHNAALDLTARRARHMASEVSVDATAEHTLAALQPQEHTPYLRTRILEALAQLSEELRAVVVLYDVEGYTHAEIGERLRIPAGTSKSRLHAARRALREQLHGVMEAGA